MSKKLTNEEFLNKLFIINEHYRNGKFKVLSKVKTHPNSLIVKDEFGYCKMTVNSLFKNSKPSISSSMFPKNYLINKLSKINKSVFKRDILIIGEYVRATDSIIVKDKFGLCEVTIANLLKNRQPSIKSAIDKTSYFINKIKHLTPYDYSKTVYGNNGDDEIIVTCKTHGDFKTTPNNHTKCPKCKNVIKESIKLRKDKTTEFVEKSVKIHGDKYEYHLTEYVKAHDKVKIVCKKHGEFNQNPNNHLNGQGCPKCISDYKVGSLKWWCDICNNKEGIFYILKCYNNNESFIKIGITCTSVKNRYRKSRLMPYNYEILYEFKSFDLKVLYLEEANLKKNYKNLLYSPKISFGGSKTECFNLKILEKLEVFLRNKNKDLHNSK